MYRLFSDTTLKNTNKKTPPNFVNTCAFFILLIIMEFLTY